MYIVPNSGMRHLAAPSCECSMYESLLYLRCKKKVVVGKWISNTSNVHASRIFRWNCCIFFWYCCILFCTVAYIFLLLHKFLYCYYLFFIVACLFFVVGHLFVLLQAKTYCCHRKVIVACKCPFWATVLFCSVLHCAELCCAVLCCAVLCCAVLSYAILVYIAKGKRALTTGDSECNRMHGKVGAEWAVQGEVGQSGWSRELPVRHDATA